MFTLSANGASWADIWARGGDELHLLSRPVQFQATTCGGGSGVKQSYGHSHTVVNSSRSVSSVRRLGAKKHPTHDSPQHRHYIIYYVIKWRRSCLLSDDDTVWALRRPGVLEAWPTVPVPYNNWHQHQKCRRAPICRRPSRQHQTVRRRVFTSICFLHFRDDVSGPVWHVTQLYTPAAVARTGVLGVIGKKFEYQFLISKFELRLLFE